MIESINGLLQQFLHRHRAFRNLDTLQLYLNLFTPWHICVALNEVNVRAKAPGKSPGLTPAPDDWLALLGYPTE